LNTDPFEWETHFQPSAYGPTMSLDCLSLDDAEKIIDSLAQSTAWSKTILNQDPALRLPLFATLTGLAIACGRDELNWDRESVSRFVLERNRTRHWVGCSTEDENVLAYVSITGPQSANLLTTSSVADLFPKDPNKMLEHNQLMTDNIQPMLMPLEPSPLAELFVLDCLGRDKDPYSETARGHRTSSAAFQMSVNVADFTLKAMMHYPDHSALPRLIAAMIPQFDQRVAAPLGFGIPILNDELVDIARSGHTTLAQAYLTAARILRRRSYPVAIAFGADADFNFASTLAEAGDFHAAIKAIDEFEVEVIATNQWFDALGKAYHNVVLTP